MVEFQISNEIFLGIMAIFIVPLVLYLNRIMNKLSNLVSCFQTMHEDYLAHKQHSEMQGEKLNQLSEKSSIHNILIEKLYQDIKELQGKKSPV